MQQTQQMLENPGEIRPYPLPLGVGLRFTELDLGDLEVPVAELVPQEIMGGTNGFTELKVFKQASDVDRHFIGPTNDPAVGLRARTRYSLQRFPNIAVREVADVCDDEAARVPQLVDEVAIRLQLFVGDLRVVAGCRPTDE